MDKNRNQAPESPRMVGLPSTDVGPDASTPVEDPTESFMGGPAPATPRPSVDPSGSDQGEDAAPSWREEEPSDSSWFAPHAPLAPADSEFTAVRELKPVADRGSARTPLGSGRTPIEDFDPNEPITTRLAEGEVLFKKYELRRKLGTGGMGEVWLVHHLRLEDDRALKFIRPNLSTSPEALQRFIKEARAMARVKHENTVAIHDVFAAGGMAFIDMDVVDGKSLEKVFKTGRPMPLDLTFRILRQLCDVLSVAHRAGIVHRDLKPANLMLVDGRPAGKELLKVLDFGIAKLLTTDGEDGPPLTMNGPIGTYPYMSPEQFGIAPVDARSDLYTVGVILFEFLTGYRPYKVAGNVAFQWYEKHVNAPVPTFVERNPQIDLPPEVEAVVRRCLSKSPADRPQSAQELFEEFEAAAGLDRPPTPLLGSSVQIRPIELIETHRWTDLGRSKVLDAPRPAGRRLGPRAMVAIAVVFLCGAGFALGPWSTSWRRSREPSVVASNQPKPPPPIRKTYSRAQGEETDARGIRYHRYENPSVHQAVFLPEGCEPEGEELAEDGWPRFVVRAFGKDKVRFVRIVGTSQAQPYKVGKPVWEKGERDGQWLPGRDPQVDIEKSTDIPGFYMQQTEVSNRELYRFFVDDENNAARREKLDGWANNFLAKRFDPSHPDADLPAVFVSLEGAEEYARWVGGALPSRAQWQYAASSRGERNDFAWGPLSAAEKTEVGIDCRKRPVNGPQKDITLQGLFHMGGNVSEWVGDLRDGEPFACGGSFDNSYPFKQDECGVKAIYGMRNPQHFIGFRVVLDCPRAERLESP